MLRWTVAAAWLVACGADDGRRPRVGTDGEPALGDGIAGEGAAGGIPGGGEQGGASASTGTSENELTVDITEPPSTMSVEIITIRCAGECADVEAVASGGHGPYDYAWSDGVTTAAREICADEDTDLSVTATDTPIRGEFPYDGQTATANLTARVLDCSTDGGAPPVAECFVKNASFEGAPAVGLGDLGAALPDWAVCWATPDVNPIFSNMAPTDGATYLGAVANANELNFSESAGGSFCEPLQAGQTVSFTIDLATSSYLGKPSALEIWGGATPCSKTELLWVSPTLTEIDVWQTACATITPSEAFSHLVLWPVAELGGAYLLADNIQAVSACP